MTEREKSLLEAIQKMREFNLSDEEIKDILDLEMDVDVFLLKVEQGKQFKTVKQTVEILKERLGEKKERFNEHKILRCKILVRGD